MSNGFDIAEISVYLVFMFTDRVRRAFRAVSRHVDVLPDTLVLRALEGGHPAQSHR
jgi:membrane-anchored protein YejM (alkaline phosphatase superfamily)